MSNKHGGNMTSPGAESKQVNMALYLDWLLTPEGERQPKLKQEFAAEIGVSSATLRNYDRDPWLQGNLAQRARATARIDQLPKVLNSLLAQAKDPENSRSVQAAKVWLDYVSNAEDMTVQENLSEMPEEKLLELMRKALASHSE